jgi:curli production assembly/transport component CsgG
MKTTLAQIGEESPKYSDLKSLPVPQEKIIAAVYKFRDQTGQYKTTDVGTNWSTAVTQGATSILIRSMEESGWFVPIEREGLPNLLNERKIIRSSRATYGGADPSGELLPPLLYAGVLLEGGIISFDSNILTGGAGARYLGLSSSGQYREDRVTIYLRAVSTVNGKILKTIYTSKTILSQKVDVGVFRFVAPNKLLEAEAGFTYNEPSEMAVREAIEQAVIGLVIEGIEDGLWATRSLSEKDSLTIKNYQAERANKQLTDPFGSVVKNNRREHIGVHVSAQGNLLKGDYSETNVTPGALVAVEVFANKPLSGGVNIYYGNVGSSNAYKGDIVGTTIYTKYKMLNKYRATPFIQVGLGVLDDFSNNRVEGDSFDPFSIATISGSLGVEYLMKNHLGITGYFTYTSLFKDQLDGVIQGTYNDYILNFNLGANYYFKRKPTTKTK